MSALSTIVLLQAVAWFAEGCQYSETRVSGTFAGKQPFSKGELIFEENFDNFNLDVWQHEITLAGGGNWEFQAYTNNRSNSYVEDGHLHIRPTLVADEYGEQFLRSGTMDLNGGYPVDQCTDASFYGCVRVGTSQNYLNPIKSAKIKTAESFSFKYGRLVVRAKTPRGDWLWPAIWLMPRYNSYGKWPASGEIDLLESRGNENLLNNNGANIGTQQVASTLHWGPFAQLNQFFRTHHIKSNGIGFDKDFHTYELQWSSSNMSVYFDNELIGVTIPPDGGFWKFGEFNGVDNPWKGGSTMAPFDQQFYLIINLAVGGIGYFGDDTVNPGGKPWKNNSPTAYRDFWRGKDQWISTWDFKGSDSHLMIDYVRVYSI